MLMASPISVAAEPSRLMVPAYGNPCCGTGRELWDALIDMARPGVLDVILNPNSGPGAGPIGTEYIQPNGQTGPLLDLARNGASITGYVHTQWARRELDDVLAEIDRYFDSAYNRNSSFRPNGIFVDEMSNDLNDLDYYHSIAQHLRAEWPEAVIVGNPGTASVIDSSQGASNNSTEQYATVFDQLVVFEGNGITYRNQFATPDWIEQQPADRFVHIIHSDTASEKLALNLRLAADRNVSTLFVTDDVLPNPYDRLPTYWSELLDELVPPVSIDELSAAIRAGKQNRNFDLNQDGNVNENDRSFWLENIAKTTFGDSNLDGHFDSADLLRVLAAGQYNDQLAGNSSWQTGDWTGDGEFDSADVLLAMQTGRYEQAARQVPEPLGWHNWLLGLWCLFIGGRRALGLTNGEGGTWAQKNRDETSTTRGT